VESLHCSESQLGGGRGDHCRTTGEEEPPKGLDDDDGDAQEDEEDEK
jgi:hypothetical protein